MKRILALENPELVLEWSEKNYPLKPDMMTAKSNKKILWRCNKSHEWMARIADRVSGHGCRVCELQRRIL